MNTDLLKNQLLTKAHWRLQQQFQQKAGPQLLKIITASRVIIGTVVEDMLAEWPFPRHSGRQLESAPAGLEGYRYQDTSRWDIIKTIFLNDRQPVLGECFLWLANGGPIFQMDCRSIAAVKSDILYFSEIHEYSAFALVGARLTWGLIVDSYSGRSPDEDSERKDGVVFEYCRWGES